MQQQVQKAKQTSEHNMTVYAGQKAHPEHAEIEPELLIQRSIGNHGLLRRRGLPVQPELKISEPDDMYEQEADRVAETVMRMPEPQIQRQVEEEEILQTKPIAGQITPLVQRQIEEEEEEEILQAKQIDEQITPPVQRQIEEEEEENIQLKSLSGRITENTPPAGSQIKTMLGQGQALPNSIRDFFEPRFGFSFDTVRIHEDMRANDIAKALNAKAFTTGREVVFGEGYYSPQTVTGRRLIAHELAHVIQQNTPGINRSQLTRKDSLKWRPEALSSQDILQRSPAGEDPRISRINSIVQEEIDSFLPSYKVILMAVISASRISGLPQLVTDLRARKHEKHGTYFKAMLRIIRSRGGEVIFKFAVQLMARSGVGVFEEVEEYPLRYQIADYISQKITETKGILIGEPKDSIWWVLKATLVETFYTLEEGFVDVLRVGQGSEEAARAYYFEKDAVDRWCTVVKGLSEDFLRLTVIFAPAQKAAVSTTEKTLARQLAGKADDAIEGFARNAESVAGKATAQAEKQAARSAKQVAEATRPKVKSSLTGEATPEIGTTKGPSVSKTTAQAEQSKGATLAKKLGYPEAETGYSWAEIKGKPIYRRNPGNKGSKRVYDPNTGKFRNAREPVKSLKVEQTSGRIQEKVFSSITGWIKNNRSHKTAFGDVIPDYLPAKNVKTGKWITADNPKDALFVADSKYYDETVIRLTDQIKGFIELAQKTNPPSGAKTLLLMTNKTAKISQEIIKWATERNVQVRQIFQYRSL